MGRGTRVGKDGVDSGVPASVTSLVGGVTRGGRGRKQSEGYRHHTGRIASMIFYQTLIPGGRGEKRGYRMRGPITSPATFNLSLNTCPLASWLSGGGQGQRGGHGKVRSRDGALFDCQDFRGQTLSERQLCPAAPHWDN